MKKQWAIIWMLGFSSGLPLALIGSTLQAWFADSGASLLATSSISLLGLPYLYRIFWGPLLDSYSLCSIGRRRSWMLIMQLLLLVGFMMMPYFSPTQSMIPLLILAFLLACFSATQDAAIDAHRIEYLPENNYGLGASVAILGYRLALMISGGFALVLATYAGWTVTYCSMALLMFIGIVATLWTPEPYLPKAKPASVVHAFTEPLQQLAKKMPILPIFCFILTYKLGEAFTATSSGIVMPFLIKGLGFSLEVIGYINKLLGIGCIVIGGIIAGLLLLRYSLYKLLLIFGLLQALTNGLFVALAIVGHNVGLLAVAVACDNTVSGMASTALVALLMRLVDKEYTATQFSLLVAVSSIPRIFSGPVAALMQSQLGWVGLYEASCLLALGFIPFLIKIKPLIHNQWIKDSITAPPRQRFLS